MTPQKFPRAAHGFTLTELVIVMVIAALLIGSLILPLGAQQDLRSYRDTQQEMTGIVDALTGFAASHLAVDGKPYLPCPDTDNDGNEDRSSSGGCLSQEGRLPWNTLGIGREDAWGNRYRYRVAPLFANSNAGFTLTSAASLKVCENAACSKYVADTLPAVVVSHGKNGAGAYNAGGSTNAPPAGDDEKANQDANNNFVSHAPSPGDAPGGEFDDLVAWISPNILFSRMLGAGRLP